MVPTHFLRENRSLGMMKQFGVKPVYDWAGSCQLTRANVSLILESWWPEIVHGGSIDTMITGELYKSGLF